jgi:transposase
MIARLYVGVDISKEWFDVVVLQGRDPQPVRYENSEEGIQKFMLELAGLGKKPWVCMEYTGGYELALAMALKDAGITVSLIDGGILASYRGSHTRSKLKTDAQCAWLIARFCKERQPNVWIPVPDEYAQLRELVTHIDDLTKAQTAFKCRNHKPGQSEFVNAQNKTSLDFFALMIAEAKKQIQELLNRYPRLAEEVELLKTIPGIAVTSAVKILAETGPIENYSNARSYSLHAGLCPIVSHSGKRTPPGRLPVYGNRNLRSAFYWPVIVAMRLGKGIAPFTDKVSKNGIKLKMTVIAAGMRKLSAVVFGILKHRKAFDQSMI